MRRIFHTAITAPFFNHNKFRFYKPKPDLQPQSSLLKSSLFNKKSFNEIINIIKNPDNPYPKNAAYFYAVLQCILDQSSDNSKIMLDHGDVIHVFLQEIMERIKTMGAKELSEILGLLRFRPKALRFEKELLITMHVRFETRIKQLIDINELRNKEVSPQEKLSMQDLKAQIEGLFYLKKNTSILQKVLDYSYQRILKNKNLSCETESEKQLIKQEQKIFYSIIEVINQNLDDTIDPVRESISQFIQSNYYKGRLPYNKQVLRMIVKCKFYKNYPIVRNEDWMHQYVYSYMKKLIDETTNKEIDIEEFVSVLKSVTQYAMHVDPWSFEGFVQLIDEAYLISKKCLLSLTYESDKEQLSREVNTIGHQIKLIPSYIYLKNYLKVSTVSTEDGNKVDSAYIKSVINQIKPIIKKFVLCYFQKTIPENQNETVWLSSSIEENIEILNNIIKKQDEPEKLLLKSVENLLNTVTVFKDYNIINIDTEFSLLLIQTEIIYCILCRQWISDEVRYLRLLEHSAFVVCELEKQLQSGNPKISAYAPRIQRIKSKMQQELSLYDTTDKSYKQFTVLRLVAILRCMGMKPKCLQDFYRNVKVKKPNIYVETLSRTMLKGYNYQEVIDAFQLMFQGKIQVKQIQLGRIVFLSSKEPHLLKYWMHFNRKQFVSKVCFCRRIINNIVSIIRMDNLEINRNSIQLLSQIVIENKLFQIQNHSISNHQESNALKKILCNNFSILFRYSKMDSMIDDIFIVHKNIPTIFRNRFSHIEMMKILTFSAYLSEEQSIFYINRENKNALFKYVIMLMKKQPFCERQRDHYLLGKRYDEQDIMLSVVDKIIEQYWPDNKLTNKGMPFYAQFLNYYTQINKFSHLVKNENTVFLIIKEILQDYRQVQNKQELKFIISRIQNNYQRLHFLSIFQHQTNINNTLENVISSMNFVMDMKIFGEFSEVVEGWIRQEIQTERSIRKQKYPGNDHSEFITEEPQKGWKKNSIQRHLINVLIMEPIEPHLSFINDYQILSLLTVDILVHGIRHIVNENMQHIIKRLIKINPISINLPQTQQKKKFPFELFKILMSNMNIYLANRQKRIESGKELASEETSAQKINEWMLKCLLTYSVEMQNNEEIEQVLTYFNNWNVDILSLVKNRYFNFRIHMQSLAQAYYNVQILSVLFSQNIARFNVQNNIPSEYQLSNQSIVQYIKIVLQSFTETHLMNNYGVYFQQQGEKVLNIIKSLLMSIIQLQPVNSEQSAKVNKEATHQLKIVKELFEEFNRISNKTSKYNKLRNGGKYSYLYNEDQGEVVDMLSQSTRRNRNPYSQSSNDSVTLKLFSSFSEMLEIISLIRFSKWSVKNVSQEHLELVHKINSTISKRQKALLIDSELTYFTDTEPLIEEKSFSQLGLKLYAKKPQSSSSKLTLYYIINQKQSLVYDFAYKKRKRLTGQEQVVVDYLESLIKVSSQMEGDKSVDIEVKVLPHHLTKAQLKKMITAN